LKTYTAGARVTLTAAAANGYQFIGWSGDCLGTTPCTLLMNANKTVSATFSATPTYTVTVSKAGAGSGTVGGAGSYAAGVTVNLTATPATASTFAGWSPSPCASSFAMPTSHLTCTANFHTASTATGDRIGVFRAGDWQLDANGNGVWEGCGVDRCVNGLGMTGDLPVTGDWNGSGTAKMGAFRNGTWYLDYNGNGAWDGCGVDKCYEGSFGIIGDLPVAGRW